MDVTNIKGENKMDNKELKGIITLLIKRINSTDYVHIHQLKNDIKLNLSMLLNDIDKKVG
jgi:2,3-bisphosphoglycerate-independent phosphoglycerate mutase